MAGTPVVTDNRTLVDFLIPKLERAEAFGGGVAYYTSPVRGIFQARWERDDAPQTRAGDMFPFHPPAQHLRLAQRSIREATAAFPAAVRRQALDRARSWQGTDTP